MLADDYVAERLSDYDSKIYQLYRHKNGQKASDLVEKVKNEIAECGLSATEAKGFLEYMKIVIDAQSEITEVFIVSAPGTLPSSISFAA